MKTVAVDFDGVIHAYRRGWHDGTIYDDPMPGALEGLHELMRHYAVVVHTTREPEPVIAWLEDRGFTCVRDTHIFTFWDTQGVLLVTSRKLPAVAYVDDRAVRFVDWTHTLAELTR